MTEHVRTNYRNHRKATWGLAIALVVAIAAVVIPIASGASDKTYTILFPSTGAVTPTPPASGNTTSQTLCPSSTYAVRVTITNTAKSSTLGSADVTFPANVTLSSASLPAGSPTAWQISRSGNVVSLRELSLPKNRVVTITAALGTGSAATSAQAITARVKQSNDFNDADSNPDANSFDNPTFPTILVQSCNATITGRVYHDRDQSGAFAVNASSPTSDIAKQGWTVTLQRKTGATTYTDVDSDSTDVNGLYSVAGPSGSDFRLCVTAPNPPDSSSRWAARAVTGVTLVAGCVPITPTSGTSQGLSVLNLPITGATGQDFAVIPITAPDFGANSSSTAGPGTYVVTAAGNTTKAPQNYVQETWTDSGGHPYFVFAPINACSGCAGKIYLLEHMSGSVKQSDLGATKQVVLVYDDIEPFQTFTPMPYCLQDPRRPGNILLETGVLPADATSCIVEGHQTVDGDGTAANASVDFEFFVYTSYDGSRGFS
jgi:hypothetical protein